MKAMVLEGVVDLRQDREPLRLVELPEPEPGPGEVRLRVRVCGVCHTELDEIEGRLKLPRFPATLGHQVVGTVDALGAGVRGVAEGERLGVAWIHSACGACEHCRRGEENLCATFQATGRDAPGGYAEKLVVPADFTHALPSQLSDEAAAPLLCAGAIGHRSLALCDLADGDRLGLTGFGASGHLVLKLARYLYPSTEIYVFARDPVVRDFARSLGATWSGDTQEAPPVKLRAIIDTTPAWTPVVAALAHLQPGGRLVVNAIRKEAADKAALLELDYPRHLWLEKELKTVANVTRADVRDFLSVAAAAGIQPKTEVYALEDANAALLALKEKPTRGALVLRVSG
ncbi:MAG: alcohol dehydrogenase catalytic domain-containing protein [Deltaproteobacteria bacterium]|nr:alcohol dehydrogenase catalytic domain-containing protein [Deltaproteobacteria bacterium]